MSSRRRRRRRRRTRLAAASVSARLPGRSLARKAVHYTPTVIRGIELQQRRTNTLLSGIEDGRIWRPERRRDPRYGGSIVATTARNAERPIETIKAGRPYVRVANPRRVLTCARRNQRRQSLFATGRAGRGRRIFTRRRHNETSKVRC